MKTCCMILLAAFTSLASAQQNDVTSILEVLDVTNGRRTVVKEFPLPCRSSKLDTRRPVARV